jgi:hypothetical protein
MTNVVGLLVEPFSDSLHKEFTGQPSALIALTVGDFLAAEGSASLFDELEIVSKKIQHIKTDPRSGIATASRISALFLLQIPSNSPTQRAKFCANVVFN